jgi:hypothetical protein
VRASTQTVTVEAPVEALFDFLSDPKNLPRWAIGFAKSIRRDDDQWIVETSHGEMPIRIVTSPDLGIVDFHMAPAPGSEAVAFSRVVANGNGAEYCFTQFQPPNMPDEVFEAMVNALSHELVALKALMEVKCPL